MRLIPCPYCRADIQDDGTFAGQPVTCPHCAGQFMMPPAGPGSANMALAIASAVVPRSLACPQCHSNETQSVPIVYAGGTSTSNTVAIGGGLGIGPVIGGGRSVSRTNLAQRLAPPAQRLNNPYGVNGGVGCPVALLCIVLAGVVSASLLSADTSNPNIFLVLLAAVAPFFLGWLVMHFPWTDWEKREERRYVLAHERWSKQYFCHRCGCVFTP